MEPIVTDQPDNGGTPAAPAAPEPSAPGGQGGNTPPSTPVDESATVKALREQLRAAQDNLAGRQTGNQPGNNANQPDLSTPEGQYAVALEIASARLSNALESVYSLYPEIPADEIARVRANPWAFVSDRNLFLSADWEKARWQVEDALYKRAEEINASKAPAAPAANPATVTNNPAPVPDGGNGLEQDQDPWTMPMDELEKIAMKEKAKLSSPK